MRTEDPDSQHATAGQNPVVFPFLRNRVVGTTRTAAERRLEAAETLDAAARREACGLVGFLCAALGVVVHRYTGASALDLILDLPAGQRAFRLSLGERLTGRELLRQAVSLGDAGTVAFRALHEGGEEGDVVLRLAGTSASPRIEADASPQIDSGTVSRMTGHLATVIAALVADPDRTVAELPLLTAQERRRILVEWNATRKPWRTDATLHQLFEETVARYAEDVAVIAGDREVTYAELNARANELAHRLIARGVGPESRVGICLERTTALVVAVLAVLKAGGAYVPLDPANPPGRIAMILEDAGVELLLTQASLRRVVADFPGPTIDVISERDNAYSDENPEPRAKPESTAYVIYTSGSTGKPKGVVIEHRNVVSFIAWTQNAFSSEELSAVLLASSIAFDVSVFELFAPLCSGGLTVVVDNVLALRDAPHRTRVRTVCGTTAGLSALVSTTQLPASVMTVLQAGELMHATLANALYAQPGVRRVLNLCGATEDTVYSVSYEVPRVSSGNPPIGRPFDNRETYVLDARMEPVPVGVPGELYYAGVGVAREYLNREELTRERFIPNPFDSSPYRRLYRSGDVVRYLEDGNIEYISRTDDQLKIRGFRVELGEIEAQLAAHPAVAEIVVVPRTTPAGETVLVAYAALRPGAPFSLAAMRAYAADRLPEYMIPSLLVVLDELPHSTSGKVNRRELPAPDFGGSAHQEIIPADAVEAELLAIWREMLVVPSIGPDDDFFELGGHSLIAARILARIRDRFDVSIGLRDFFETPRVRDLARRLHAARPKRGVDRRLDERVSPSLSQEQLWFLERLLPNRAVYNVPLGIRLRGPLDEVALVRALDALMVRHEQLRATFPVHDGTPSVDIAPVRAMPLRRVELEGDEEQLAHLLSQFAREPFDLETGPLVHALLVRRDEKEHVLALTMHHIVSDGWSIGLIFEDLAELYAAIAEGREPELTEFPAQFTDYAATERAALADGLYEPDVAYWTEHLAGAPQVQLAGDRAPKGTRTFDGGRVVRRFSRETSEALRQFARATGATLSAVLLGSYAGLIARYTREEDLVFGVPTACRDYPELEAVVGYFIGMAALRVDASGEPTFAELVERAKACMFDGLDHQPVPMQLVVERLAPQRSGLNNPLFSLAYVTQTEIEPTESVGVGFEPLPIHNGTAKFDLLLEVIDAADEIEFRFEYAGDVFDRQRIDSLATSFGRLVEGGIARPETPVARIPLLDDAERARLSAPAAQLPGPFVPVVSRFEACVRKDPGAVALRCGDDTMTYGELDAAATRLAHRLGALGAGPGECVGVCAQRSPSLLVALLAVVKSGAAYVPLDPQSPAQRLSFIAQDAGLKIVLADRSSRNFLPEGGLQVLVLEDLALEAAPPAALPVSRPDDVAYVIYTSGSTGIPKGVAVTHENVARLFTAADSVYDFGPTDRWTLFHSYAFDFSVWELWGALAYGGTLVIVPAEITRSPRDLRALLARERVTVLNQTPSAFYALIAADAEEQTPLISLRYVIFGGEGLDVRRLKPWFDRYGEQRPALVNMYGITETTVHVTHRRIAARDAEAPLGPIGVPLADLQIYLLDAHAALVPDGAIGEIYVGGAGVARGYVNRDELTRERFLANPLDPERGERVYRSGDLARRRFDGSYEYVGRGDSQVKIRGFRIELGEIEVTLAKHPGIERAVVLVEENGSEGRLVAYLVLREGTEVPADLRAHLAATLPQHMIPSTVAVVPQIPLTENGKLDRRALLAAARAAHETAGEVAPLGPVEQRLAEIFAEMLGVERVGVEDNFFFRGGHSLLAARVIGRVEREFPDEAARLRSPDGRSPILAGFYVDPTIRGLATTLMRGRSLDSGRIVPLRPGNPEKTPLFWFHGMFNGDGLYSWNIVEQLDPERPVWVLHPHGYDDTPFEADINLLATQQFELIRSVAPRGPYHIGGFCNGGLIAYEIACRLEAAGEEVASLFLVSPPPMLAGAGQLHAVVDALTRALRLGERRRMSLNSYLYHYAQRLGRFFRGDAAARWRQLRRGFALAAEKFRRARRHEPTRAAAARIPNFADPQFKNDWYLVAISEYVPRRYHGTIHVVRGRETIPGAGDPSYGWSRLARETRLHYVDGGHFCVVDSPKAIATLLRDAIEGPSADADHTLPSGDQSPQRT